MINSAVANEWMDYREESTARLRQLLAGAPYAPNLSDCVMVSDVECQVEYNADIKNMKPDVLRQVGAAMCANLFQLTGVVFYLANAIITDQRVLIYFRANIDAVLHATAPPPDTGDDDNDDNPPPGDDDNNDNNNPPPPVEFSPKSVSINDAGALFHAGPLNSLLASPSGVLSWWQRGTGPSLGTGGTFFFLNNNSINTHVYDSQIGLRLQSADGNSVLFRALESDPTLDDSWHHIIFSWNTATSRLQLFIDGIAIATSEFSGDSFSTLDLDSNWVVGGIAGNIAELYFIADVDIDLTDPANLAKFISASKPADLDAAGFGTAHIYLSQRGEGSSEFITNRGSGGDFTLIDSSGLTISSDSIVLPP